MPMSSVSAAAQKDLSIGGTQLQPEAMLVYALAEAAHHTVLIYYKKHLEESLDLCCRT